MSGPKAVCPKCGGEGGHWGADGFEPCDGCGGTGRVDELAACIQAATRLSAHTGQSRSTEESS